MLAAKLSFEVSTRGREVEQHSRSRRSTFLLFFLSSSVLLWPTLSGVASPGVNKLTTSGGEGGGIQSAGYSQTGDIVVEDIFGRRLNESGLVLVDWEGYLANPAIKFFVIPPANSAFPATAQLSANDPRMYFDLPSQVGPIGPTKTIAFQSASSRVPVLISNFPDRDTLDSDHLLSIQFTDASTAQTTLTVTVHEIDQDKAVAAPFEVTIDFSRDQTGFFSDAQKRAIVQQGANDWAYFVDNMNLDTVPSGAETTFIWNPDGFVSGSFVTNASPYTGFLLYAYGIHSAALRSGGEPSSAGGFQSSGGVGLPLKRSGGVEIETQGNFNTLGWFLTTGDDDWWRSSNLGSEQNDLYSISHHEMGHSIIFNPAQPLFAGFKNAGAVQDPAILAYHGSYPRIDAADHLAGEVDNASRRGAFGNEYFGDVPSGRWLITKLDVLVAQAIGYKIRKTSAFVPLSIANTSLPIGYASAPYAANLQAGGGIPFYNWTIDSGALPPGLALNSFTGAISGIPNTVGTFSFNARVRDYAEGGTGVAVPLNITISVPSNFYTLAPCRVADTRDPNGPYGGPALVAGTERVFAIAGQCGIPLSAKAVSLNVTVTQPTGPGHIILYPGGTAPQLSSAINYRPGQTRANNAIVPLGVGGTLAVQSAASTHFIIDVNGYFE